MKAIRQNRKDGEKVAEIQTILIEKYGYDNVPALGFITKEYTDLLKDMTVFIRGAEKMFPRKK